MGWPQDAYVGQKVARVYPCPGYEELNPPPICEEVTISWIGLATYEGVSIVVIDLIEYPSPSDTPYPGWQRGWAAEYFRPVIRRKTDISIFTAMLGPKVREQA